MQQLDEALELLMAIREQVHSNVESSVLSQLDVVIEKLEQVRCSNHDKYTPLDILMLIARFVEVLPQIAELFDRLQQR